MDIISQTLSGEIFNRLETVEFDRNDIFDVIRMFTSEADVITADEMILRHMLFDALEVRHGNDKPNPIMQVHIDESWRTFAKEARKWVTRFGMVFYSYKDSHIAETIKKQTVNSAPSIHDIHVDESQQYEDEVVVTTFKTPYTLPYDFMFRARIWRQGNREGVIVMDSYGKKIDPDIKIIIVNQPIYVLRKFASIGSTLLSGYRHLATIKLCEKNVLVQNAFSAVFIQHVKDKRTIGDTADDNLDDPGLRKVIYSSKDGNYYERVEDIDDSEDISDIRRIGASTDDIFKQVLSTGIMPDRESNMIRIPEGFQVVNVPTPTMPSEFRNFVDFFSQSVCAAFEIHISHIRPALGRGNTLTMNAEHMEVLHRSAGVASLSTERVLKHVWCEIYPDFDMKMLSFKIPNPNPIQLEDIALMEDRCYISHDNAIKKALNIAHLKEDPDYDPSSKPPPPPPPPSSLPDQKGPSSKKHSTSHGSSKKKKKQKASKNSDD